MGSEAEMICQGRWHPAGNAASLEGELHSSGDRITVEQPGQGRQYAWSSLDAIAISSRVAGIPRRLEFPDGSTFETRDNDAIDAFLKSRGKATGFVHAIERFHPRLLALTVAVILMAVGIYRYALPVLVAVAVFVTPQVVPEIMSKATLASMDKIAFEESRLPEARKAELTAAFGSLVGNVDDKISNFNLNFRHGGAIGANAFALPDGTIVLTDELVALAPKDEMILGVLAHEIGHVELKHSLRQLYRVAGYYGLLMLIAGDIGSGVEDIVTQGGGLLALSYSRSAESEADRYSVTLMAKAGHNPAAIAEFFDVMKAKLGGADEASIFSTHPGGDDRKADVERYVEELKAR